MHSRVILLILQPPFFNKKETRLMKIGRVFCFSERKGSLTCWKFGALVKLVIMLPCHGRVHGFESHTHRQMVFSGSAQLFVISNSLESRRDRHGVLSLLGVGTWLSPM